MNNYVVVAIVMKVCTGMATGDLINGTCKPQEFLCDGSRLTWSGHTKKEEVGIRKKEVGVLNAESGRPKLSKRCAKSSKWVCPRLST